MTSASSLRAALAAAFLGLQLGAAVAQPQAIAFDITPRAGQHQRQLLDMQVTTTTRLVASPDATEEERAAIGQAQQQNASSGRMKMSLRMEQIQRVGQPDAAGWLPLTLSATSKGGEIEVGGKKRTLPQDKHLDMLVQARFNPQDFAFDVLQVIGGQGDVDEQARTKGAAMVNEALQLPKALIERPLKVGDSVEVPLNMALPFAVPGSSAQMDSKLRYTLKRVERGIAHFDLSMDMQIRSAAAQPVDPAASAPATEPTNMQLTGSGKGSSTLRLADRLPLSSLLDLDVKLTMQAPDNGRLLMTMRMQMKSKGESLAKPVTASTKKKKS